MKSGGYEIVKPPKDFPGNLYNKGRYCHLHHLVYWQNTGVVPNSEQVIHHKDGNKFNNSFDNLELLYNDDHVKIHDAAKGRTYCALKCSYCGATYILEKRKINAKNEHSYCSKECMRKAFKLNANEKEEFLSKQEIIKEFKIKRPVIILNHDYK
jgi:hypothetical protein